MQNPRGNRPTILTKDGLKFRRKPLNNSFINRVEQKFKYRNKSIIYLLSQHL